jgi:hypothetical protein
LGVLYGICEGGRGGGGGVKPYPLGTKPCEVGMVERIKC